MRQVHSELIIVLPYGKHRAPLLNESPKFMFSFSGIYTLQDLYLEMECQDKTADSLPMDKYIFSYFSKGNNLNKHILTQEKSLAKYLGERWNSLPQDKKDILVDFLLVDDDVRHEHVHTNDDVAGSRSYSHISSDLQESFPRLNLNSGQKINVDFESDVSNHIHLTCSCVCEI